MLLMMKKKKREMEMEMAIVMVMDAIFERYNKWYRGAVGAVLG